MKDLKVVFAVRVYDCMEPVSTVTEELAQMRSKKVALFLKKLSKGVSAMERGDLKANWGLVPHRFV